MSAEAVGFFIWVMYVQILTQRMAGFVFGDINQDDVYMRILCVNLRIAIIAPEYRYGYFQSSDNVSC